MEQKEKEKEIEIVLLKMKTKFIIFGIINFVLMILATIFILSFHSAYAGGFFDYFSCFIMTFLFLQIIPFIISIVLGCMMFEGAKKNNECCLNLSRVFLF